MEKVQKKMSYYNLKKALSYIWSVIDWNAINWYMTVLFLYYEWLFFAFIFLIYKLHY